MVDVVTSSTAAAARPVDKHQTAASVTARFRHCRFRGWEKNRGAPAEAFWLGGIELGINEQIYGSFAKPVCDMISCLAPQSFHNDNSKHRDYPWRRRAYDRTLTCPDLARVINDFLSSDIDFAVEEEFPVQLCA